MDNEIESEAPPPVSSLRSRFEALSRGGAKDKDSPESSRPSRNASSSNNLHAGSSSSRPTTPSVVVSPAKPSELSSTALRRVVSSPTNQPASPSPTTSTFSRPNSGYGDPTQNVISLNGDDEDLGTPSSATPRRTPSTPNFGTAARGFPIGLGLGMPLTDSGSRGPSRNASGSSSFGHERSDSAASSIMEKAITDVEQLSKKLTKRPPPPPPGKKAPPPPPPPRSADARSSTPSSRSETPIIDLDDSPPSKWRRGHRQSDSANSALAPPRLPARSTPSPTLPPRSPSMVPISSLTPLTSPPLPPRSADNQTFGNVVVHHSIERGFKTPSTERLSYSGSDGSEHGKPSLVPPRLPSRSSPQSFSPTPPASAPPAFGPPLPPRHQGLTSEGITSPNTLAPPLPPRSAGASAPASLSASMEDTSTRFTLGIGRGPRKVPPPPRHQPSPELTSPNGSRESLTPVGESAAAHLAPAPPPQRTISADSVLPPPPTRTVHNESGSKDHRHERHHQHHHYPHLPHQLHSLPITKILAAVKMGGGHSNASGSRSPQGYSPDTPSTAGGLESNGTNGLPPPPMRNKVDKIPALRPSSSGGGKRRVSGDSSSDEEDILASSAAAGVTSTTTGSQKRTLAKIGEEMPDSSRSNRRPPVLEEFQHPPNLHSILHHGAGNKEANGGLHVPAHTGVVAVAGWWVAIASHGSVTIMNMNPEERDKLSVSGSDGLLDKAWAMEKEMELALGRGTKAGAVRGVWTIQLKDLPIEWKADHPRVTAMEFRHGSTLPPSSANASRASINADTTRYNSSQQDYGRYLWCGTKDGYLLELDVWNGGRLVDFRVGAHTGHVTGIFRLRGGRMLTVDENGKCLVFCGIGTNRREDATSTTDNGRWLSRANPRVQRVVHKDGFMRVLNGRLWTSPAPGTVGAGSTNSTSNGTGSGESKTSLAAGVGGSLASLASSSLNSRQKKHQHNHQKSNTLNQMGPNVKIYDIDDDGAFVMRSRVPGHNVGAVMCGTILPSTPGLVYLGHEGGWVTIWGEAQAGKTSNGIPPSMPPLHRQQSTNSTSTSPSSSSEDGDTDSVANASTNEFGFLPPPSRSVTATLSSDDEGGPVCLAKVKISISDILSLEGVGSRLWAGNRKGFIIAYDVTGNTEAGDVDSMFDVEGDASVRPWVVTNIWKAHGEFPVLKIGVDPYSVAKTQRMVVYSLGRDEVLRFWDGFLAQNWIDSEMLAREPSFCTFRPLKVLMCTWNIDAAKPDALVGTNNVTSFQRFLNGAPLENTCPDLIIFGFQEVIDLEDKKLTAKTVLLGSSKRTDGTISDKVSKHYRLWHDRLVAEIRKAYPNESYIVQHTENLVGLFSCVFVRRTLAFPTHGSPNNIRDVAITTIKCGMHGMYGNKGAIVARFTVDDTSFCFLNCHLAAGQAQKMGRNMDLAAILEDKTVFPPSGDIEFTGDLNPDFVAYVGGGDGSMILDHEICFLSGDLNYRIDQRRDAVISHVGTGNFPHLLQYDQLLHEIATNPSFRLHTFTEAPINFAPTYKYDRGTLTYDTSEKKRIPAWCDRILYRSQDAQRVECLWYGRFEREPDVSDHRPVGGLYRVVVKKVVKEKRAKELATVKKLWEFEQKRLGDEARIYFEEQY